MPEVREIWFSIRQRTVCHLYPYCGRAGRILDKNERTMFVEVDDKGLPLDLPPMAVVCKICRGRLAIRKAAGWPGLIWHLVRKRH